MFETRSPRNFNSAPQSVTAFIATVLEPAITVAAGLLQVVLGNELFDQLAAVVFRFVCREQALQAFADLQACGAGFAVNEDFGHGVLLHERRGAKGAREGANTSVSFGKGMVRRNMIHSELLLFTPAASKGLWLPGQNHSFLRETS